MADIKQWSGLDVSGATPAYRPLALTDFVSSGVPDFDPFGVLTAPATCVGGIVTIQTTEQAVQRNGYQEGAILLLRNHEDWIGDGTMSYRVRVTPQNHPGVTSPLFMIGFADRGADPTAPGTRNAAIGIGCSSTVNMNVYRWTATDTYALYTIAGIAFAGNAPALNLTYQPMLDVGDEATDAGPMARWGAMTAAWRRVPNDVLAMETLCPSDAANLMVGRFRPYLGVGWRSTGADVCVWSLLVEWCVVRALPVGTY